MTSEHADPLNASASSPSLPAETLVNGRTFLLSSATGELLHPGTGAVFEDIRYLSRFTITLVDDEGSEVAIEHLRTSRPSPLTLVSVTKVLLDAERATAAGVLIHRVAIGRGSHHRIEYRALDGKQRELGLRVDIRADFAHIFDMKARHATGPSTELTAEDDHWRLGDDPLAARVAFDIEPDEVDGNTSVFSLGRTDPKPTTDGEPAATGITVTIEPVIDGTPSQIAFPIGSPTPKPYAAHLGERPGIECTSPNAVRAYDRAIEDLLSLRISDPTDADSLVVAAGAPWFMTLFGRDSLLTSAMILPVAPELAVGVLHALATLQGQQVNPVNEEEPGKIIHELRRRNGAAAFEDRGRYYGTVDATPLFVMVARDTWQWGHLGNGGLTELWPAVEAATKWIIRSLDNDPAGWLTYERSTEAGLANQGWKDSWDGVSHADGTPAKGPIALVEVQGYAYAALLAAAELAEHVPDSRLDGANLRHRAERMAERFNDEFWDDDLGSFVLALDGENEPLRVVTTNPGHAVWSGIADPELAERYLDRCMEPDMFTGWGLRTLSSQATAYNPLSYHNGSVWPHDTGIVAAGAAQLGRIDVVQTLATSAFEAASGFDDRPPELHAGFGRTDIPTPVPYPSSSSPQAWASAAMIQHIQSLVGLHVDDGEALASRAWGPLQRIRAVRVGDRSVDIEFVDRND